MEQKPLETCLALGSLQTILSEFPDCLIRGKVLQSVKTYNITPPYFNGTTVIEHGTYTQCDKGLLVCLKLKDTYEKEDRHVPSKLAKLLKLPKHLIVAITLKDGLVALVRNRTLAIDAPVKNVHLKLHLTDVGSVALFFDQVPELCLLNAANQDHWMASRLRAGWTLEKIINEISELAEERGLDTKLYVVGACKKLIHMPKNHRTCHIMTESKLSKWFPRLDLTDKRVALLFANEGSSRCTLGLSEDAVKFVSFFQDSRNTLFSLFGDTSKSFELSHSYFDAVEEST